jgi:hypothetical protein
MLDPKILSAVSRKVQQQFPEIAGVKPTVRVQHPPQAKNRPGTSDHAPGLYLVTYRGTVELAEGKNIPRLVRVVVNADGKILKISTSR